MSENDPIKRVNRATRKDRIEMQGDLFPQEGSPVPDTSPLDDLPVPPPLDLSALPDTDADDVAFLATMPDGLIAKPLRVTPPEQRYPPVAPNATPPKSAPSIAQPRPMPPVAPTPPAHTAWRYNALAFIFTVGLFMICGLYTLIWFDPYTIFNPFPPAVNVVYVTATPAPVVGVIIPTSDPVGQPASPYPYQLESAGVLYIANPNASACNWASVAGKVTDKAGASVNGYRITVTGEGLDETVFSGSSLAFGEGSYELQIGGAPRQMVLTVQLFSPQRAPLSPPITVDTRATCTENVAIVNFVER